MAVRTQNDAGSTRRALIVALGLAVLFAVALFLRAYWNLDAATQDGQFVLSGGSDPYYHKRAVDAIQAGGYTTLFHDPLLNYPYGAVNPNPPLYEWSIAVAGQLLSPFFGGDLATSTWWAALWSPVVFSALTLFPIYFIGRTLFDWRVGLVAAAFWALSTSAIDTGGLGDADHDSAVMFFATMAFLFYIKAIDRFRGDGHWVADWRRTDAIAPGLARFLRERRAGILYALLSGVAVAGVALIWKGFPYVIGIMFLYAGLQMVMDHWRSRDSLGVWTGTFLAMTVGTLLAYPYYAAANVVNFVTPVWFILGAFLVAGLVLVPTRDLPTILVMPAAAIAAILGAVVAFFVIPEVARGLLYATVYFKQTALYETIAEAHPADFSNIVFGIGPVPFFAALFGWFTLLFTVRRHPGRAVVFALVWGAVALFMANSAIRFLHNAIPAFAVFGAYMTVWVVDWLDFSSVRKSLAANQGNAWHGFRKGFRPIQVIVAILAVFLLVVPNVMLAADAALPPEKEQKLAADTDSAFLKGFVEKRFGAYGQGFIPGYWREALEWLDERDADIANPADRPAFLSWWDYGHWAIAVGNHPTVADNFQNGYEFAANFILAQNETHAVQLLAARQLGLPEANAEQAIAEYVDDPAAAVEKLERFEHVEDLTLAESVAFLAKVEENTGKRIRYFAVDVRMLPFDNPQSPRIEQSSIFFAPVKLAGESGDDYVPVKVHNGIQWLTQDQFTEQARDPTRQVSGTQERLEYTQKFFDSMYWRAYAGTPVQTQPGQPTLGDEVSNALNFAQPAYGLQHFRLVYANDGVKIIEYTPGATVRGAVTEEGSPIQGATLTAYDDAGNILIEGYSPQIRAQISPDDLDVPHGTATTDAEGRYELVAPFSMEGGNVTIVASRGGVELARESVVITRDAISQGEAFTLDLQVQRGVVEGIVFEDKDGNGGYNESVDALAGNVTVSVGGKSATTGEDGTYRIEGVSAGVQNVTVDSDAFVVASGSARVRVSPGEPTTHNVSLLPKPGVVEGLLYADLDDDGAFDEGEGLQFEAIPFEPAADVEGNLAKAATGFTDSGGNFTQELQVGTYAVLVEWQSPEGDLYRVEERLEVGTGETIERDLRLVRAG